jgi:hypothetical protein
MINEDKLGTILYLNYIKNYGSSLYNNHEGNYDFCERLSKYLVLKGVNDFEIGDYMGNEKKYPEYFSNFSFIKYNNLIFDSCRFGQNIKLGEKSISENNGYEDFDNTYFEYSPCVYSINDNLKSDLMEDFDNIEKELDEYGLDFLIAAYTIENNYRVLNNDVLKSEDTSELMLENRKTLNEIPNLKKNHLDYIINNDLIKKNNKFIFAYSKLYSSRVDKKQMLDISLIKSIGKNISKENLISFKQNNKEINNTKVEDINFGF